MLICSHFLALLVPEAESQFSSQICIMYVKQKLPNSENLYNTKLAARESSLSCPQSSFFQVIYKYGCIFKLLELLEKTILTLENVALKMFLHGQVTQSLHCSNQGESSRKACPFNFVLKRCC